MTLCSANNNVHCLHYQECDGDCCDCGKKLAHCDVCGWAGEITELCPECGDFICPSYEECLLFRNT